MMRKALLVLGGVIGVLLVLMVGITLTMPSRQVDVPPAPAVEIDAEAAAQRLADSLRIATISNPDPAKFDTAEFLRFHRYLADSFPLVHARLEHETVNDLSLLYRWPGSDPALAPILLLAHYDVVPVVPGTEDRWEHPPFGGVIADGFVWGRGAIDDKFGVLALLEAVEHLLQTGFAPTRTVYLAFGHDEEVGGPNGAVPMAELLQQRGVQAEFVLDEGGAILVDIVPRLDAAIAAVGIAEKGSVTLELSVKAAGGHSSTPPQHTAIGVLSRAITRLEDNPMPRELRGAARKFFDFVGPEMPFPLRVLFANLWLLGEPLEMALETVPQANATLRTTTAATIIAGGVQSNVLPTDARASVNFRILPGDTIADVAEHARRVIDDEAVTIEVGEGAREPSPVSPVDGPAFDVLQRTFRAVFPEVVVAPFLTVGGTDSRHFGILTPNVYRILPFPGRREDMERIHGSNERVKVEDYARGIGFYVTLLRNTNGG
jgi:carboxypeptidase PM20D1